MFRSGAALLVGGRRAVLRGVRGSFRRSSVAQSSPLPLETHGVPYPSTKETYHPGFRNEIDDDMIPSSLAVSRDRAMRILFLTNAHNGMSQALYLNLTDQGYQVKLHVARGEEDMLIAHDTFHPDAIVAPFLTKRVPERLWKNNATCPVLIVHPGVRGDRGVSSIDWALKGSLPEWGVTVLQADKEMDAGDVWGSVNFSVPHSRTLSKSAFYNKLCVPAAVAGVNAALGKLQRGVPPRPLDYSHADVTGTLQPTMKLTDRAVNWSTASAEDAAETVRFSDSSPGCPHTISGTKYRLFGAHTEAGGGEVDEILAKSDAAPGEPVGCRNGAVLFKCADGKGIWISHMKQGNSAKGCDDKPPLKLPADLVLPEQIVKTLPEISSPSLYVPFGERPSTFQEVWVSVDSNIAHVHSDFYNGASSTAQCERLTKAIREVGQRTDVKAVLLMGGDHSFGNGINLNTIEASAEPEKESWRNINAINDTIKEAFSITDKLVISVMRGNAGAGGAMAAMASDVVWAHENVILNPHYKAMELTGSEYWTYFLPERVGHDKAAELTNGTRPITARQAHASGMVDDIMRYPPSSTFREEVTAIHRAALTLVTSGLADKVIAQKQAERDAAWFDRVERFRTSELVKMKECFASPWHHDARRRFVYKSPTLSTTPTHMVREAAIPALPLNGKLASKVIRRQVKDRISSISANNEGRVPGLGIVMANGRPDSSIYVDAKVRAANGTGMMTALVNIPTEGVAPTALEAQVLAEVIALNERPDIDGIVVQMPLPTGVDCNKVARAIAVHKDADACNPVNAANVLDEQTWSSVDGGRTRREFCPLPCTPHGIVMLLAMHGVRIVGQNAVVIGKSRMVGTPMATMLSNGGATVTQCDIHTDRTTLERKVRNADIVVAAAGKAGLVRGHWIRPGAVVVDVAMNTIGVTQGGKRKVVGDVEYDAARAKASYITPVPGGVGPMTVALLLQNTLNLFEASSTSK
ncbi:unnamed protein product [Ascophyllum nodosum]